MNAMNYDRKTLKERAKASLRGIQPRAWKPTLLYLLVMVVLPAAVVAVALAVGMGSIFSAVEELDRMGLLTTMPATRYLTERELALFFRYLLTPILQLFLVALVASLLLSLVQALMEYGYANYSLKLYRGEQTAVRDIFSGFSKAGRVLCTAIMVGIFTFLWSLLVMLLALCAYAIVGVIAFALSVQDTPFMTLMSFLINLGMGVCVAFIRYRYSLAPYFIMTTDMGTMEAIQESKAAMRDNLGRRFVLDLSFLGWELLNVVIVYVVTYVGIFVTLFGVGYGILLSGAAAEYMDVAMTVSLMSSFMGGVCVTIFLGTLAEIPLCLWLTPYKSAAEAGFFLIVTGQDDAPAAPQSAPEYIPPQPSGIWDNVPTPPPFTPSAPVAPEAPAAPVTAEETSAPAPEQSAEPEVKPEEAPVEPEIQPEETPASEEAAPPKEDGEA